MMMTLSSAKEEVLIQADTDWDMQTVNQLKAVDSVEDEIEEVVLRWLTRMSFSIVIIKIF